MHGPFEEKAQMQDEEREAGEDKKTPLPGPSMGPEREFRLS